MENKINQSKQLLSVVSSVKNNPVTIGHKQRIKIIASDSKSKDKLKEALVYGSVIHQPSDSKKRNIKGSTDGSGMYSDEWTIEQDWPTGEYVVDLNIHIVGYDDYFTKNTFVVNQS